MKTDNTTHFTVDTQSRTIHVKREFQAPLTGVWKAWTEPGLLDQWWAPRPWKSKTRSMVLKEGGMRHYAMVGPGGEEHWSFAEFQSITHETNLQFHDGFCDKETNINMEMPQSDWNVDFSEQEGSTRITVTINHENRSDLEKIIEMGFREGFIMALDNLNELLLGYPS